MGDERNFRSSYYEKVGCRGVEEKKSLEILLKEKPWDKMKLKQFCLRFAVPAAYRNLIWKVLLGILPVYPDSHQFVQEQRTAQYDDLLYALQVMEMVDDNTPQSQVLFEMWHLENGWLEPLVFPETNTPAADTFIPIAESVHRLFPDEVDAYWLSKSLAGAVRSAQRHLPRLAELARTLLEREDRELYVHLLQSGALPALPLAGWFNCCFAGVLDDASLPKIWDKVCAGAPKILSYCAVMLCVTLRRRLLAAPAPDQAARAVAEIPEQFKEVIANKAVELWQHYGAQPQGDQLAKK